MGEGYRARDPRLNRNVALKILPAEVAADPSRRQRFEIEARAVAALSHPNIVSVYDSIFINLMGPTGWTMPSGSQLQVIVSQANSPGTAQGYSPFIGGNNVSYPNASYVPLINPARVANIAVFVGSLASIGFVLSFRRASPKSSTLTRPAGVIARLLGLMSR